MKITRGFLGLRKAKSKIGEATAKVHAGILEGLYGNSAHPKVTRARAKQRIYRIKRAGTNPYRAAIEDQNKLVGAAAKARTAIQNPGTTVAEGVKWVAENPGAAVGGALNAAGVTAATASGNPGLAAAIQATPLAPGGAVLDQKLQQAFPGYTRFLKKLGRGADAVTNPIRDISSDEILSMGRVLSGNAYPGDLQVAGNMLHRSSNRAGEMGDRIVGRVRSLFIRKPALQPMPARI